MLDDVAVAAHLRALLNGQSPNGAPPEAFGPWQEVIAHLHQAYAAGGLPAVRAAWQGILRRHPELAALVSADQATAERQVRWSAKQLLSTAFPTPRWVVPGVLSEGLGVLAGRPKLGKSWLALQFAQAVACGGKVFEQSVEPGPVLYIALEDSERRLQQRLQLQHWPTFATATFYTIWKPLDAGGLADLQAAMQEENARLVIVDTLSRALSGRRNQSEVGEMTEVFSPLQRLALEQRAAILLVDHHSKIRGMTPDPVDDILGSTGKAAAADIVMGLYRERGKKAATLQIVGRDLEEDQELTLDWDGTCGCWQRQRDTTQATRGTLQAAILAAVSALHGEATTTQVAEHLGKDKGNVHKEITELVAKGALERGLKEGREQYYQLPSRF